MSLDDKLNPHDRSLIDHVDSYLLRFHSKIADYWQEKSHRGVEDLVTLVGAASFAFYGADFALHGNYESGVGACGAGLIAVGGQFKTAPSGLETEIHSELMGLGRKGLKLVYITAYGLVGCPFVLASTAKILYGVGSGNYQQYLSGIETLPYSLGLFTFWSSLYLLRTNPGNPPPKPKKKPLWERVKELLPSPPVPRPVEY